jgi:chromosomal replication initiator protein
VTRDDREIVSAVQSALADKVGKERYEVWFGRGVRMEPCGTTLRIAAADIFRLDYLRRAFREQLVEVVTSLFGNELNLEFAVDSSIVTTGGSDGTARADGAAPPQSLAAVEHPETQTPLPAERTMAHRQSDAERVTHRLPRRQFASLADFLASEPNRVAFSAAHTAAAQPGKYSPLTFVGPPGSGKTHLLEGIWRRVRESQSLQRVIYLSAEQFTNQFLEALRQSGTPSFRRKCRDVELLLIDDVQFFAGKQSTLVELVHTIDTLLREGRQLVFAIDRPPAEFRTLGAELIARLSGGLLCTLEPADFATRLGILQQLAAKKSIPAPPEVLSWMATQLEGDARLLAGGLHRLRAASEAHQQSIDLPFAQEALRDLVHAGRRPVRLPDIVDAVCDMFGVQPGELKAGGKSANVTLPRMLVMFLARKWTRSALSEISHTLGRRSHSTVVSAQHKVTEWLATGKTLPLAHGQCRVEDAIKRVESQLRLA